MLSPPAAHGSAAGSATVWLAQEMAENMSLLKLNERLQDPMAANWIQGIFPRDTPRNMRFAINFFTSIGLGGVTDALRAHLKELPKLIAAQQGVWSPSRGRPAYAVQGSHSPSDQRAESLRTAAPCSVLAVA